MGKSFLKIILFTCFWLCSVSLPCGLSSGCREQGLLSSCGAQAPGRVDFSSCGSQAPVHRLHSWGTRAWLLRGMWDFSQSGMEPVFPALAGRFFFFFLIYNVMLVSGIQESDSVIYIYTYFLFQILLQVVTK